jgi:hypothetical protein
MLNSSAVNVNPNVPETQVLLQWAEQARNAPNMLVPLSITSSPLLPLTPMKIEFIFDFDPT